MFTNNDVPLQGKRKIIIDDSDRLFTCGTKKIQGTLYCISNLVQYSEQIENTKDPRIKFRLERLYNDYMYAEVCFRYTHDCFEFAKKIDTVHTDEHYHRMFAVFTNREFFAEREELFEKSMNMEGLQEEIYKLLDSSFHDYLKGKITKEYFDTLYKAGMKTHGYTEKSSHYIRVLSLLNNIKRNN